MSQHPTIRTAKGLSTFFMPSSELARFLLSASFARARKSGVPNSRSIANTISCLVRGRVRTAEMLDRVRKDVSLHLWRYLGTLSRRGAAMRGKEGAGSFKVALPKGMIICDLVIEADVLAGGMRQRLGMDNEEREISNKLVTEFVTWLNSLNGYYEATWGTVVAIDGDRIGISAEADEQTDQPERERVEVTATSGMSVEDIMKLLSDAKKRSSTFGGMVSVERENSLVEGMVSEQKD